MSFYELRHCYIVVKYMDFYRNRDAVLLFLGDIIFWVIALWLTLLVRYAEVPGMPIFQQHIEAFWIIFLIWALSFFIANLYGRQTVITREKLPNTIFNTQIINSIIAVLFFYFIPYFGITPKVNLFIDLVFSFLLILLWRLFIVNYVIVGKKLDGVIVGEGQEVNEIQKEIGKNQKYKLHLEQLPTTTDAFKTIDKKKPQIVILNVRGSAFHERSSSLHNFLFSKISFADINDVYEGLFGRVAVSLLDDNWFLENVSLRSQLVYTWAKRIMDIVISFILAILSLPFYPLVYIAIKLDDGGPIFITQERIGESNKPITITKFRSMSVSDDGKWVKKKDPRITRTGSLLRKTRIDELPQLFDVLRGSLSLIGPRPELPKLAHVYEEQIPYYKMRHLIKPGLSGWAQIHHEKPPHSIEETKEKLSYDLYYIKNKGIMTDVKIALRTIKTLLSRSGV